MGGTGRGLPRTSLLASFLLAACSGTGEAPPPVATGDERIACAVGGSAQLADVCSIERVRKEGKLSLVVRHPDGAFRRFDVTTDGTGVAVADGAEPAQTALKGGKLDVSVGADRYLFPATVKPDAGR